MSTEKFHVGDRVAVTLNAEVIAISLDEEWLQVRIAGHKIWVPVDDFVERIPTPQELDAQKTHTESAEPTCKVLVDGRECGKPASFRVGVSIVGGSITIPVCESHCPGIITSIDGSR